MNKIGLTRALALLLVVAVNPAVNAEPPEVKKAGSEGSKLNLTRAVSTALEGQLIAIAKLAPASIAERDALKFIAGRFERIAQRSIDARSAWLEAGSHGGTQALTQVALEQMNEGFRELQAVQKALDEKDSPFGDKVKASLDDVLVGLDQDLNIAYLKMRPLNPGSAGNSCGWDLTSPNGGCKGGCSNPEIPCRPSKSGILNCLCREPDPVLR